jgi:signal transduction histidine kinase/ActR/RegA family two-component response regulator
VTGYLLTPLFVASAGVALVLLALYGGRQDRSRVPFLLLVLSLELWSLLTFQMRLSRDPATAVLWDRAVAVAAVSLFVTYLHFCRTHTAGRPGPIVAAAYAYLAVCAPVLLFTDLGIVRMVPAHYGWAPVVGPAGMPIVAGGYLLVGTGITISIRAYFGTRDSERRNRLLAVAVAGFCPLIGAAIDGFTDLPPVSVWANLVFSVLCTVAVLRYRLLDIQVVARRGAFHLLLSTLLALPYIVAFFLLHVLIPGRVPWWVYAAAVLLFAALLRPLYGSAQEIVDRLFYGRRYDFLFALRNFNREIGSSIGHEQAAGRLTELVRGVLQARSASILQRDPETSTFAPVAARTGPALRLDGPVARWLQKQRRLLSSRTLTADPVLQNLPDTERQALERLDADLASPVFSPQGELAAIIVVGPKASGRPYTVDDRRVLETVGAQAALALENSRLYADAERSRRTLEAWLQNVPDSVLIVDQDSAVRFANAAAQQRLGLAPGSRSMLSRHDADGPARFTQTVGGREYEIASAPFADPTGGRGIICVLRDVSERRDEEARRAAWERRARITSHLASIGEMAAGIAHEINNPLTAVIGYSGLLKGMNLRGEEREMASQILLNAERVAGITQRMLTFARQKTPERRWVCLNDILRSTIELRSYALRSNGVRVEMTLDESLPDTAVDPQQIQQVLLNLIINAESAMAGVRRASILTLRTWKAGDRLCLSVGDSGPGIPEPILERIFDPFFTTKQVGEGSGLGLSICHGIVTDHGGRIVVRNVAGSGAEFLVEIPLVAAEESATAAAAAVEPPAPQGRAARILVVDDEVSVRQLVERILQPEGHTVDTLGDGRAAYSRILDGRYDLMLLDVRMPLMSGLEVHDRVSRADPAIARRIVLITGDVMAEETRAFVQRTGVRCITKPFNVQTVRALVQEMTASAGGQAS